MSQNWADLLLSKAFSVVVTEDPVVNGKQLFTCCNLQLSSFDARKRHLNRAHKRVCCQLIVVST